MGHVVALLLVFVLSSLAALQQASALLRMDYLVRVGVRPNPNPNHNPHPNPNPSPYPKPNPNRDPNQASGGGALLWMGYLLLSLLVLVRGTWRQAMRTISHNRRGAWLGRSSAIAGAIFRPANPTPPPHPAPPTQPRRPRLGAAQGQREKQWEMAVGGGLAWHAAHRYAWLVLLLILIYQVVVAWLVASSSG